ncbi:MAG: hypothetical protein Q9170_005986 [Blastenia crenularia]
MSPSPPSLTASPPTNSLSDVFSDSPPASPSSTAPYSSEPSDIPRLRSVHVTNGYREGISTSKDQALQPGFDEAYPLGAILGLRAGYALGILEGLCSVYGTHSSGPTGANGNEKTSVNFGETEGERLWELLVQARKELKLEILFGKDYWGSDGMWAYEVQGKEEEVTFWEVSNQHPVVRKWTMRVRDEVRKAGILNADEGFVGAGVDTMIEGLQITE